MSHFLCPIKEGADLFPHLPALILPEEKISYFQLNKQVEELQGKLRALNVKKMGIYHPPEKELIPLLFAAFREKITLFIANTHLPFSYVKKVGEELGVPLFIYPKDILKLNSLAPSCFHLDSGETKIYLLTSGTTHTPKLAALTIASFYYNALGSNPTLSLKEEDVWLLSLPLYHVSGLALLFRVFLAKASLALYPKNSSFEGITHLSFVTTQLRRLLSQPLLLQSLKNLKCLLLGGGSIPENLYVEGKRSGLPIFLTYGLTEMSSSVLITSNPLLENGYFYLGEPLPFREMKLQEDGEILLRGKTLFCGYFPEEKTSDWFFTKDLGKYKKGAGFAILGRKDRMFISGGENIQPEEIERQIMEDPNIREAYVLPREDEEFGHIPVAFIRMAQSRPEASLEAFLRERLPSYKVPRQFFSIKEENEGPLKPDFQKFYRILNPKKTE